MIKLIYVICDVDGDDARVYTKTGLDKFRETKIVKKKYKSLLISTWWRSYLRKDKKKTQWQPPTLQLTTKT